MNLELAGGILLGVFTIIFAVWKFSDRFVTQKSHEKQCSACKETLNTLESKIKDQDRSHSELKDMFYQLDKNQAEGNGKLNEILSTLRSYISSSEKTDKEITAMKINVALLKQSQELES